MQLPEPSAASDGEKRDRVGAEVDCGAARPGARRVLRGTGSGRDLVAGDDVDADAAGAAHEIVDNRAVQHLEPARARGLADDDLGDVVRLGVGERVLGDGAPPPGSGHGLAAEAFGKPQGIGDAVALRLGELRRCARSRRGAPSTARAADRPARLA